MIRIISNAGHPVASIRIGDFCDRSPLDHMRADAARAFECRASDIALHEDDDGAEIITACGVPVAYITQE